MAFVSPCEAAHPSFPRYDAHPDLAFPAAAIDANRTGLAQNRLCWLENRFAGNNEGHDSPALSDAPPVAYPDHTDLSVVRTAEGKERKIRNREDWKQRRAHILVNMQLAMGPLPGPELRVPLNPQFTGDPVDMGTYSRRKVTFSTAPGEHVIAWLLRPHDLDEPGAAMLCLHPTYKLAKDEVAGLGGRPSRQYGRELAERGFVCLVPDYPSFGEDHFDFESNPDRWRSGSMKAIWNNIRSIDFLETLPNVDPHRIGAIGHSLGGHNALFTAAFDERIAAVVTSCGFTEFHAYYGGNLKGWTSLRYMPRIASEYGNDPDRVPFDFQEVLAAIAPRPIFINAPLEDSNFDIDGVRAVAKAVEPVYELMRSHNWQRVTLKTPEGGHDFPTPIREQSYDWLGEVLE